MRLELPGHRMGIAASGDASRPSPSAVLLSSAAVSLALGVLTAYAQGWLPAGAASLANSAGTWVVVAFVVSARMRRVRTAAVTGAVSLLALVLGYYVTDFLRGFGVSLPTVAMWAMLAVVVGPVLGVCAGWLRAGPPPLAAIGGGFLGALLIAEGWYGLHYVAATTSVAYWWAEIGAGLVVVCATAFLAKRRAGAVRDARRGRSSSA